MCAWHRLVIALGITGSTALVLAWGIHDNGNLWLTPLAAGVTASECTPPEAFFEFLNESYRCKRLGTSTAHPFAPVGTMATEMAP
jgi:hypothetical protein